jgi:uncharacterized iron-regulated membrane protein
VAVTGSLLVFAEPIDRWWDPQMYRTSGGTAVPVDAAVATAMAAHPSEPWLVRIPRDRLHPLVVIYHDGSRIAIDPASGQVLGHRSHHDGAQAWMVHLHTELLLGETGRWIIGGCAVALLVIVISGMVLWWPGCQRIHRGFTVSFRHGWWANRDVHRVLGALASPIIALLAATGAAMIFYTTFIAIAAVLTSSPPAPAPPMGTGVASTRAALQPMVDRARVLVPDGEATYLYLPKKPLEPVRVRLRTTSERHPNGRTFVFFDVVTGDVLRVDRADAASPAMRAANELYPLHIGAWAAGSGRWATLAGGVATAGLTVTGLVLFLGRRPRRSAAGRKPSQHHDPAERLADGRVR